MLTHRQKVMEILSKGSFSLRELSVEMRMPLKEVLHHLTHVRKSIRPPFRFTVEPALCLKCEFVFKDRKKLSSPSKCPKCKSTYIKDPEYTIL